MTSFSTRFRCADQADGLRKLFAGNQQQIVPVAANAQVDCAGVLIERLSQAFSELGAHVLVVDAADKSPDPHELVDIDLGACIELLDSGVSYLAARGLPRRHVNTRGSCETWLAAVQQAASHADVIIVHAQASDLARMLGHREVCPILVTDLSGSDSITDAYASMKLLSQRCGLMAFDLMVATANAEAQAARVADRLASCADAFLSAVLRSWSAVNRTQSLTEPAPPELSRLAATQLTGLEGSATLALPALSAGRVATIAMD